MAEAGNHDLLGWYNEIPPISRLYLTASFAISTACFLEVVSPLTLYYNYELIMMRGQYWRLISSFLFFGTFGIDFLFHMYFVVRYCRMLEEGTYRGRTADFVVLLIFGAVLMLFFSVTCSLFSGIKFLGHPLSFMMVYLWSREPENVNMRMGFFGVIIFDAPYLPWVLLVFSLVFGNPIEMDLLGIVVGHLYYFLQYVYPKVAALRGWRIRRILVTPSIMHYIFGTHDNFRIIDEDPNILLVPEVGVAAAAVAADGDGNLAPPPPVAATTGGEEDEAQPRPADGARGGDANAAVGAGAGIGPADAAAAAGGGHLHQD